MNSCHIYRVVYRFQRLRSHLSSSKTINPGNRQGNRIHHQSMGKVAVRKREEKNGTNVGNRRVSRLATMPTNSQRLEKGLKVKADLYTERALMTKPK